MILPDFVVGGAPKCGTGSLFAWLSDHPLLCGSTPKEPFYFMDRDNPLIDPKANVHTLGLKGWSRSFSSVARPPGTLYFEGTTHVIYQETALSVLPDLPTKPKLIFVLRDPLERVESSFNYTRANLARVRGGLTLARYCEMLAAGDTRDLSRFVTSNQSAYVLQRDLQYSNYWRYLSRWLEAVGPERMLVLQFEKLTREPLESMRGVCAFLGVSPDCFESQYDFAARNLTVKVAHNRVHRWAKRLARVVPPGRTRQMLSKAYYWLQSGPGGVSLPPTAQAREALRRELAPGTRKLAEVFDIDLRLWRGVFPATSSVCQRSPADATLPEGAGETQAGLRSGAGRA